MEGFCRDCGQLHLVAAETQEEADEIANSEITITRKNDKIDIKRVKKQTNQMMI